MTWCILSQYASNIITKISAHVRTEAIKCVDFSVSSPKECNISTAIVNVADVIVLQIARVHNGKPAVRKERRAFSAWCICFGLRYVVLLDKCEISALLVVESVENRPNQKQSRVENSAWVWIEIIKAYCL